MISLGVVLHSGVQHPAAVYVDRRAQQDIAESSQRRAGSRSQGHFLVFKAQALCNPKAGVLSSGIRIQKPGRDAQCQQVVVSNFVVTHKSVVGVNAGKVEVIAGRVVVGQQALVAVGCVDVVGPGLQGLHQILAPQTRVALKHQPTVQAEGGDHALCRSATIRQGFVKLVATGMQLQLGDQETGWGQPRPAELHYAQATLCIGLKRARAVRHKTGEIALHGRVKPIPVVQRIAGCELGGAVIGWDDGSRHILKGLPLQHTQRSRECTPPPGCHQIIGKQALRQGRA